MDELMGKIYNKFAEPVKRMTVGPVPSHPKVLEIVGKQFFSTRDALFVEVMPAIQKGLQESVGTKENFVQLEHGSGSSGLCSIGNQLLYPGAKVIVVCAGKFGERWVKIAKKRGCEVEEITVEWGKKADWKMISEKLKTIKPLALLMQHSETSTGSLYEPKEAREAIDANSPDTLLVLDAISSWGSLPINMDQNNIDVVAGCSQKGFMLPTGLHLLAFSKKALTQVEKNEKDKLITDFSHNPIKDMEGQLKGKPRFSMDSNSIMALYYILNVLIPENGGWTKWFQEVANRAEKLRTGIKALGVEVFSDCPGDVVIAILTPAGMDSKTIKKELAKEGFEVNGSQDATQFNGIRIGNMGYVTDKDIDNILVALKTVYKK